MKVNFLNPMFATAKKLLLPKAGRAVVPETSDRLHDIGGLTPERLERIIAQANMGEVRELHRLATELEEKNWTVQHSIQTRVASVAGTSWTIEPADKSAKAKQIAEKLKTELENCGGGGDDTFADLLGDLAYSVLPGVTCSEIIWQPGGALKGFARVQNGGLVFTDFSGPKLAAAASYIPLEPAKFVCLIRRSPSGDPARGGLIRTLAWLHCFMSINFKDLLRFIERCGMPFLVAKVDDNSFKTQLDVLQRLIRNFGPDGGGIFTRGTELELMQASNTNGEVYFELLKYVDAAIEKTVLVSSQSCNVV
jgi:phage gp29-like protein